MNGMTTVSSVLSLIDRIPGLPILAVTPVKKFGQQFLSGSSRWVLSAVPGSDNEWFVEIGVTENGKVDQVVSLKVDGGVEEAAAALDMLNDHFRIAA